MSWRDARRLGERFFACRAACVFGLALSIVCQSARAEDLQFQVNATTDRIKRGINESHKRPSVGLSANWYPGTGWFAGLSTWTVNMPRANSVGAEWAANAGYQWRWAADWSLSTMLAHYQFAHVAGAGRLEYDEAMVIGAWRDTLFASVTASPNTSYSHSPRTLAYSYNLVGHFPLAGRLSAATGLGYYDLHAGLGTGYVYYNAGLLYQYKALQLLVSYVGTRAPERLEYRLGPALTHRWIAQVSYAF
jgi:uncharacterized protein (TIGR02001 family)